MKSIRIEIPIALPTEVKDAMNRLSGAGFVVYLVGGSVRDFLLGLVPKDHDLVTNATPDQICELFPTHNSVGKAFGVIKVPIEGASELEIATFRRDLEYKDHRHPVGVEFSGPLEDAKRRDFTINGLFYDPKQGLVLDYVGGMEDLKARVIRAIGNPKERFTEDALRLLRAVRFSSNLDFKIEEHTYRAIALKANGLSSVSGERVREELTQMFMGKNPAGSLEGLSETGLLSIVLPEVQALKTLSPEAWKNTLAVVESLCEQGAERSTSKKRGILSFELAWSAVLHDIGKVTIYNKTQKRIYTHHEREGVLLLDLISKRLKFSTESAELIRSWIEQHRRFYEVFHMRESKLQRWIRQDRFEELLSLHWADVLASDGNLAFFEFCKSKLAAYFDDQKKGLGQTKLISGGDLIELGLLPGPRFSQILDDIEDLVLEGKLRSKEQALEYVLKHFVH